MEDDAATFSLQTRDSREQLLFSPFSFILFPPKPRRRRRRKYSHLSSTEGTEISVALFVVDRETALAPKNITNKRETHKMCVCMSRPSCAGHQATNLLFLPVGCVILLINQYQYTVRLACVCVWCRAACNGLLQSISFFFFSSFGPGQPATGYSLLYTFIQYAIATIIIIIIPSTYINKNGCVALKLVRHQTNIKASRRLFVLPLSLLTSLDISTFALLSLGDQLSQKISTSSVIPLTSIGEKHVEICSNSMRVSPRSLLRNIRKLQKL